MHKTDIDEHCVEPMLCSEVTSLSLAAFTVPLDPQQTIENLPLQPVPPLFSVIPARDAFLLTMAVQSAYLSYHSPPVSSIQSSHAPLTFIISKTFPATELLLTGCFLRCSRDRHVWKSHEISNFQNTPTGLSGTRIHAIVRSTEITFFLPFWCPTWT